MHTVMGLDGDRGHPLRDRDTRQRAGKRLFIYMGMDKNARAVDGAARPLSDVSALGPI